MNKKDGLRWGIIARILTAAGAVIGIATGIADRRHSEQVMQDTIEREVAKRLKHIGDGTNG